MAKDTRKIHNGVRLDGTTYTDGMEDELAKAASKEQLKRLVEKGAISGSWGAGAAPVEEEVVDETEEVDEEEAEEVAAAPSKTPAKKASAKKAKK